jgi:hypothetical protein
MMPDTTQPSNVAPRANQTAGTGTPMRLVAGRFGRWSVVWVGGNWLWVAPGWYRRTEGSVTQIRGWRLVLHRVLWGFQGLVDAR